MSAFVLTRPTSSGSGDNKTTSALYTAASTIIGGNAVKLLADGKVAHSSNDNVDNIGITIGISTQSGIADGKVKVVTWGYMRDPSWNWVPNKHIFLDLNGAITQSYNKRTFFQVIATAVSATEILVNIGTPIT